MTEAGEAGLDLLRPPFAAGRIIAAFSSRRGGLSAAPFASLNVGFASGDDPSLVVANRRRLCAALGIPVEQVVVPSQVHGGRIAVVGEAERGRGTVERGTGIPATDALITDQPEVYLFITIADCAPVLFYDPVRRVVAAAHLGWRGAIARLGEAVVGRLKEEFGTRPEDLLAAVGPAIGPCCYEVGEDVAAAAEAAFARPGELFRPGRRDRPHFDLPGGIARQLADAGVSPAHTWFAGACTACEPDRWFSYRAEGARSGRMAAVIGVR